MWLESIGIGLVILFLVVGLVGAFVPLIPGTLLIWLTILVYAFATDFSVIGYGSLFIISIIAVIAGTSDFWLSVLGAKAGGASSRSLLWGVAGAILGFVLLSLVGAVAGYAVGILLAEHRKHGNWHQALKAGITGVVGWGLSTVVEVMGALVIIAIFLWELFTARG